MLGYFFVHRIEHLMQYFIRNVLKRLVFLFLLGLSSLGFASTKPLVRIGVYAPFSGPFAMVGQSMLNAMKLARLDFKSSPYQYRFYPLDQMAAGETEKKRLHAFVQKNKIAILISEGSVGGGLARQEANDNEIIHVSLASDPTIADGRYNFLFWSPASEQAAVMARQLVKKNIHTIGLVRVNHPWADVIGDALINALRKARIKVVLNVKFAADTTHFTPIINQMKNSNADIFFFMGFQQNMVPWREAMVKAKLQQPITGIIERLSPEVKQVFEGQWYVDTRDMSPDFVKRYQQQYQQIPVTEGGYAYDTFTMLAKSMNKAGMKADQIAKELHTLHKGNGVMGPFSVQNNGIIFSESVVKTIHKGQSILVK